MGLKPVHNDTDKMMHVGGKMIRPGETREVDESLLHNAPAKKPAADKPVSSLLAILDGKVPEIILQLSGLTGEALDELEAAEKAGKTRKSLMTAFTEERLRRAAADETEKNMDDFATSLVEMNEDELLEQLDLYKEDEGMLGVVQAEIERRDAASEGEGGQDQGGE